MREAVLRACNRLDAGVDPLVVSAELRAVAERSDHDPRPGLSRKQRRVLELVEAHFASDNCAPTLRQLADALGLRSIATVHEHLTALESKGYVSRVPAKSHTALTLIPAPVTHA